MTTNGLNKILVSITCTNATRVFIMATVGICFHIIRYYDNS